MVKSTYPFSASDVGSDTMTQSEKEVKAEEWNRLHEEGQAVRYKHMH